jgi:S-disulfanyl-L-cysteine oxidoreductase SoxD
MIRYAVGMGLLAGVVFGAFSLTGNARPLQSITGGVYSARQAERAQSTYQARCAVCHGDALQGASAGSPLTGDLFLSNWSGRPLSDLVDKIQKTMPFDSPGSLTRQESTDLTAYILQAGKFPAGQADLGEDALAKINLPTVRTSPAPVAASSGASLAPPLGNLSELMRAIAFYNSNIIFNLQVKNPSDAPKKSMPVPFDYVDWGFTIYTGWLTVDQAAVALAETAPLLLTPGRRCQNGLPVPLNRPDWKPFVDDLAAVGTRIYAASKARNYEAMQELSDQLNNACANCHKVYRDNGGTEGSGSNRCQDVR